MVSLDSDLATIQDPFLKQTLMLAVDGTEPDRSAQDHAREPRFDWLKMRKSGCRRCSSRRAGFRRRIGILGAVLGLIQVMQHLDNIQEVGRGIAVAFVATIYGVGVANLFLLPFAGKMRMRIRDGHRSREMMLEGVISILEGINPRMLEIKLNGFLSEAERKKQGSAV